MIKKDGVKERMIRNLPKLEISSQADLKEYFHLTFTLTCGIILTILLFIFSLRMETERYRSEFAINSDTLGFNLDLLISNQTIRMQNFESDLQSAVENIRRDHHFVDAVLRSSSFSSMYYVSASKTGDDGLPDLKRRLRIDERGPSTLPKNLQTDPQIRKAVAKMLDSNLKSLPMFFHRDGSNIFALIWRTSNKNRRFFIFAGPTERIIPPNAIHSTGLNIIIEQLSDGSFWLLNKVGTDRIHLQPIREADISQMRTARNLSRAYHPRFSSDYFRFEVVSANYTEYRFFWPLIVLGSGIAITCLFAFIIFSLINRNIEVQQLVRDKTAHLELESRKALEAAFTKTRFLANVSHEIRTPLNMILGMADLLKETQLSQKQLEYVDNFKNAGSHLLNLIDDILDMARIDSDEVKFKYEKVNLLQLVEEVCHLVSLPCHNKGLRFHCYMDPELPSFVNIDPSRLRQILINLINNSIKFTERGYIELDVRLLRSGPITTQVSRVEFSVRDTGVGIPENSQQDIFRAFYQVNPTLTRAKTGVGLGLSIVNAIVTRFNGSIRVSSKEKEGSVFTVQIPLNVVDSRPWASRFTSQVIPKPQKLLIVTTDEHTSATLLKYALAAKFETDLISADSQKIASLKEWVRTYDAIVFDAPQVVNRYNLNAYLQDVPSNKKLVFIEDVTASELRQLPWKSSETLKVLRRPLLPSSFYAVLGLEESTSADVNDLPLRAQPLSIPDILERDLSVVVVDDDAGNRLLMKAYLEGFNWKIRYAAQGEEALQMCIEEPPDILVADLQMPVMDGFTLVQKLREHQRDGKIKPCKVIILTADALAETAEQARQLDINVYLTKPIRKSEFIGSVAQLLDEDETPSSATIM